jgi:hypothetical protein
MKVGDLVKNTHPDDQDLKEHGLIIEIDHDPGIGLMYNVLFPTGPEWQSSMYLKVVSEASNLVEKSS